ncbi:uncharacterized protein LOC109789138 [Cajanus cajan]|uniref:uncharacterized protein LOC109789138 n=1 Tax=Cajanus cajan TaxID=3821 RepID=UPI00098D915B|nr:uncharacterized protein LOC109789138 [Cajanus cajan]
MKETETIKITPIDFSILQIMRLIGSDFADSRIVEKILVIVPEKYEATIIALENTKDLSKIPLVELLNASKAQEQRRPVREDIKIEGALPAKQQKFDGIGSSSTPTNAKGENEN